ncbi:MAG: HNH endonuclease [Candidatus Gastranaerophilales bacterium]|nr:HNH endonuclease [Candidatus Gastranaerophilales bacterium]
MLDDNFKSLIEADTYLIARKNPTEAECQLYLKEVNFSCPLCGANLRHRKQPKANKLYEIAHIYPNSPTKEQYETLQDVERLGNNSESFENKIALCKNCHDTQDYHTTKDNYLNLLNIKKQCLEKLELNEATLTLGLETEIAYVVEKMININCEELTSSLNYSPVKIANKFLKQDILLKNKVTNDVTSYYPYIRELFRELEGKNNFKLSTLSLQLKACFSKMSGISENKESIFNAIATWIGNETGSTSQLANEAIVSFFVQNCEVFNEITE